MASQSGGRVRAIIFLFISLLAAIVAALVIWKVIQGYDASLEQLQQEETKVTVVLAARDLYQGQVLFREDLTLTDIPEALKPEAAFPSIDELVGRVPTERILRGEIVRTERLADEEAGVGLNAIVPQGYRALSLNVDNGSAVSGFINPGNYVDILLTVDDGDGQLVTTTLEQAVLVLAVDNRLGESGGVVENASTRPSITFAVTPEQAERITYSSEHGALTLTLRNDVDVTHVDTQGATADRLIGFEEAPPIPVSQVRTRKTVDGSMVIIRGDSQDQIRVNPDGSIQKSRRRR